MAEAEWQKRHREIDELHRTILARMDESDRRAAEREKQREQQRAAGSTWDLAGGNAEHEKRREDLRAKLHAAGLREISSDELLAAVKRVSENVDGFLQRKELMGFLEEAVREICLPSALTGFEGRIHPNFKTERDWNERDALTRELDDLLQAVSRPADVTPQGLGVGVSEEYGLIGKYVKAITLHKTVPARERSIQIMPFGGAR